MSRLVPIDRIDPSPWAAESREWLEDGFDLEAHIAWLTEDIRERGIQTPLHVYPKGERYELLHGHNRLEAARRLGLDDVPVDLRSTLTDEEARREYFIKSNGHQYWSKRKVARAEWLRRPDARVEDTARRAGVSVGLAHKVLAALREERPELFMREKLTGADGKEYPRQYKPRQPKTPGLRKDGTLDRLGQMRAMREAQAPAAAAWPEEPEDATPPPEPAPDAPAPPPPADRMHLVPARRAYTARMKSLIAAAQEAADATDEEIAGVPTNDLMIAGLKRARDLLDRIITHHTSKERGHVSA